MSCAAELIGSRLSNKVGAKNEPSATPSPAGSWPSRSPPWISSAPASASRPGLRHRRAGHARPARHPNILARRITDDRLREPRAQLARYRVYVLTRHDRPTNGVHFCPALTVISRATSLTRDRILASRVSRRDARIAQLSESASALNGIAWRTMFGCTRSFIAVVGRAGEGDDVGAVEPVEQVAGAADDESAGCPSWQQARALHQPHRRLGQIARRRRWLGRCMACRRETPVRIFRASPRSGN